MTESVLRVEKEIQETVNVPTDCAALVLVLVEQATCCLVQGWFFGVVPLLTFAEHGYMDSVMYVWKIRRGICPLKGLASFGERRGL